jgi:ribosomal protein L11 methyltransferase
VSYLAVRFDADAATADAWSDALLAAGALSVDAADPRAGTAGETPIYGEPGEDAGAMWTVSRLTALFAGDADPEAALAAAAAGMGAAAPPHERFAVADEDWVRATQAQFAPIRVADGLWIVPSWCDPVDPGACNLLLDPGLAFGTGSHPTTRLCLRWLAENMRRGASVLDYGCGSGILAIAAARLGAGVVAGTDVDPQAITASRANAGRNGVVATFALPDERGCALHAALPAEAGGRYDIVVANILANPLRLLAPALAARVRQGGAIVLSGVLAAQADDVAAAYAPWFRIDVWDRDEDWVALAGVRNAVPAG